MIVTLWGLSHIQLFPSSLRHTPTLYPTLNCKDLKTKKQTRKKKKKGFEILQLS